MCWRCKTYSIAPFDTIPPWDQVLCAERDQPRHRTIVTKRIGYRWGLCIRCFPKEEEARRKRSISGAKTYQKRKQKKEDAKRRTQERDKLWGTKDGKPQKEVQQEHDEDKFDDDTEEHYRRIHEELIKDVREAEAANRAMVQGYLEAAVQKRKLEKEKVAKAKAEEEERAHKHAVKQEEGKHTDAQKKQPESYRSTHSSWKPSSSKPSSSSQAPPSESKSSRSQQAAAPTARMPEAATSSSRSSQPTTASGSSSGLRPLTSNQHEQLPFRPSAAPKPENGKRRA